MKSLILPVILLITGTAGGAAAGLFLMPPAAEATDHAAAVCPEPMAGELHDDLPVADQFDTPSAFVPLNNQFIVPVLSGDEVAALVILSVSIEIPESEEEAVHAAEPRLRDEFLQVLFDHANTGGFDGTFTATETMRGLRQALNLAAQEVLGEMARGVLIVDIVRQDV
jgi:hypothetical protein